LVQVTAFVLALLFLLASYSNATTIKQALKKVETFYEKISTLKAEFVQKTVFPNGKVKTYYGKVWIKKPGKFLWEYEKPDHFLIISSGEKVYIYYPEEKEAFVYSAGRMFSSHITIGFLTGKGSIQKDLKLVSFKVLKNHYWKLCFVPAKSDPQVEKIILVVNLKNGEVKKFCVINTTGERVEVFFKKIIYNLKLSDKIFVFVPKKGVELINSY